MTTILVGILVVIAVIGILNRRALANLFSAGSAQVGELGRWAKGKDPMAIYQEKLDDAADNLRNAGDSLSKANGLVNGLSRQVEFGKAEIAKLDARIKSALAKGDNASATTYANQLARVEKDLATNTTQLEQAKQGRDLAVKQIQMWQRKLVDAKQEAQQLGVQLEMSKAESNLADLFKSLGQNPMSGIGDLGDAKKAVWDQIDANKGQLETAVQLNQVAMQEMEDDEAAEQAAAQSILDRYKTT